MTKQATANKIYEDAYSGLSRKDIIQRIVDELGVSNAYASTLYNNAKKACIAAQNERAESFDSIDEMASMGMMAAAEKEILPVNKPAVVPVEIPSNKITKWDNDSLNEIRDVLEAKLAEVEKEYGISIDLGGMRYSADKFTTRMTVNVGSADDAAKREWDQNCWRFGLKAEDFGRTFIDRGTRFTVTGCAPRSRKYPVLATNDNGTTYKFKASAVK